ncbi:MAG: 4-(cytidine 5'-diphospho)-2-C-methyl-D-erythritol kinase [Fimbriimonadaceae bacterium]|nr:4-(cytidine 5'-diphospho)-2-C-methyl-D-erythritol kinase [Chthonomonadaceae bacterium]MCO5296147.1 4-(cytidine 5'-diphospho)-2-C-methyl-D-erythritol kinase [Fimbriimonadaceae bacterium]
MSLRLRVRCPAKFNPFLAVGPPDASGYHPIRTVFQAVSLFDELRVAEGVRDSLACSWDGLPADNTITKALRLCRELAPIPPLSITLDKQIPAQSGLGGGSSDAAGLLRALECLYPGLLGERDRWEIAHAVGADVPFFLVGGRARGEGYGERLRPMEDAPAQWLVVARPEGGVSTAEAYRALDSVDRRWAKFEDAERGWANDFERVMPAASAELADRLRAAGAHPAVLCGSGSAVAAGASSRQDAERIRAEISAPDVRAWAVHTLTRAESLAMLRDETA